MLKQSDFLETLRSVAELRRTSAEPLSKEELLKYFKGMELNAEQQEMIYQYLLLPPEVQTAEPEQEKEEPLAPMEEEQEEDSYFQMYLDDLEGIKELSEEELKKAYGSLLSGDASVISQISENWLRDIANMAVGYAAQGANLEDVIQEGNMGLLLKLSELTGAGIGISIEEELERAVIEAMEAFVEENEEMQVSDMLIKEKEGNGEKDNDQI